MGDARIPAGCIGMVVTVEQYRRQGVGAALLADALRFARERRLGLLLLDGIPNFYAQFGYTDVFDITVQAISRAAVRQRPASPVPVRFATPDDAPALLALYDQRYGGYTGSFARTLAEEQQLLSIRADNAPLVALGDDSVPVGYLYFGWGGDRAFGLEVAAADFPTALALLQRQDSLLREAEGQESHDGEHDEPATVMRWRLPQDCPTAYALADHLTLATSSSEGEPGTQLVRLPADLRAAQRRLDGSCGEPGRAVARGAARMAPTTGGEAGTMAGNVRARDRRGGVRLSHERGRIGARRWMPSRIAGAPPMVARLTSRAFTQLLWGYRPLSWIARQDGQRIPEPLRPLLAAIFPTGNAWIAGTDDF